MADPVLVKEPGSAWYVYSDGKRELFRVSERDLVECDDPTVLIAARKLAAQGQAREPTGA